MGWIRVIHTKSKRVKSLPQGAKYAALSYVWDTATESATELPRTVKDAIELTGQLGYEWL